MAPSPPRAGASVPEELGCIPPIHRCVPRPGHSPNTVLLGIFMLHHTGTMDHWPTPLSREWGVGGRTEKAKLLTTAGSSPVTTPPLGDHPPQLPHQDKRHPTARKVSGGFGSPVPGTGRAQTNLHLLFSISVTLCSLLHSICLCSTYHVPGTRGGHEGNELDAAPASKEDVVCPGGRSQSCAGQDRSVSDRPAR